MASGSTGLERDKILCLCKMYSHAYKKGIINKNKEFIYQKRKHNSAYDFVNKYYADFASEDLIFLDCLCLYHPDIVRSIMYSSDEYDDCKGHKLSIYSIVEDCYYSVLNPSSISNKDLLYFCPSVINEGIMKWSYKTGIPSIEDAIFDFYAKFVPFDCYYFHIYMKNGKLTLECMTSTAWKELNVREGVTSKLVKYVLEKIGINPNEVSDLYIATYQNDLVNLPGYVKRRLPNGELVVTVY